jgi:hypothetical protein
MVGIRRLQCGCSRVADRCCLNPEHTLAMPPPPRLAYRRIGCGGGNEGMSRSSGSAGKEAALRGERQWREPDPAPDGAAGQRPMHRSETSPSGWRAQPPGIVRLAITAAAISQSALPSNRRPPWSGTAALRVGRPAGQHRG